MQRWIVCAGILLWTGCAATLPEKTFVGFNYSLKGVQTVEIRTTCENVETSDIRATFIEAYCENLQSGLKFALRNKFPEFKMVETGGDMVMDLSLEQLHGGSAATRFWIGFGAGRSVSTVALKILKGHEVIAEKRFVETTTMPDVISGTSSNEEALIRDIQLLSRKIADFVDLPE